MSKKLLFSSPWFNYYDDFTWDVKNGSYGNWKVEAGKLWYCYNDSFTWNEEFLATQLAYQGYLLQLITSEGAVHATTVHCK